MNSISFIFICIAKVVKEIKVCVDFDNFEMGFEKQEISRLNPRVSHQQLSPLLAIFYADIFGSARMSRMARLSCMEICAIRKKKCIKC